MRLISHICTFIVVCVDVNSCTYSDSMFAVSVASHEKHDHCARMYSKALLAREKELEMKAQKAKIKGNEGPKGQNER